MSRTSTPVRCAAGLAGLLLLASACAIAQTQQVYRYLDTDGRVVYSDKPPPADARNAQAKRIGRNSIETSELSFATQQAQERFPVTLYTFSCGVVCDTAQGLLNKRGVPHTVVDVAQGDGADRLKRLTNGLEAPALQVGEQVATGFNEDQVAGHALRRRLSEDAAAANAAVGRPPTPAAYDTKTTQVVTPEVAPKGSYPQ